MRNAVLLLIAACSPALTVAPGDDVHSDDTEPPAVETDETDPGETDALPSTDETDALPSTDETDAVDTSEPVEPTPFAVAVVDFSPGAFAGFGAAKLPHIVLGPPVGRGALSGSLDVLSLGEEGSITLRLGVGVVNGEGIDLLVFENAFPTWMETGEVAVSDDGAVWHTWPCDRVSGTGCAGLAAVLSNPTNGIDPLDPALAGGDGFDLADLALGSDFVGRYVRIVDSGVNDLNGLGYAGTTGGFDLDALGVVNAHAP